MSKTYIPAVTRRLVVDRAEGKCEYCHAPQLFSSYSYEVDHIIAEKHGGKTIADNLAFSCLPCNRHKGSDIASFDPKTGMITPLFNPRKQIWKEHFRVKDGYILGNSAVGRTTVFLLQLNAMAEVMFRRILAERGLFF